jgi:VanZ family protein
VAWWVAAVMWMGVIFALSAQSGRESSGLSDVVVRAIVRASGGILAHADHEALQLVVRKCAHLCAYLVLGALLTSAWRCRPGARRRVRPDVGADDVHSSDVRLTGWLRMGPRRWQAPGWSRLGPLLIATAYAASDELHQSFVSGRSAQATDVLIDTSGALVGGVLVALVAGRASRRRMSHR